MVRFGIIGTGGMANAHAHILAKLPEAQLHAACDLDQGRLGSYAEKYGIPATWTDPQAMLQEADIEAVIVAAPDKAHAPLSIAALEAGKHVFCEKPLATSHAEAQSMVEAARKAGTVNMVNFSYRNSSAWQRAKEWIQTGELGRIFHLEAHYLQGWLNSNHWGNYKEESQWLWRLSTEHGSTGVLGDLGVHILDFATAPVGEVAELSCRLKTFSGKVPGDRVGEYRLDANDTAAITLEFANEAVGTVTTTRCATGYVNALKLLVCGGKGALRLDLDEAYSMIERCRVDPVTHLQTPWERLYCGSTPGNHERFLQAIQNNERGEPDFARGAEVQRLLDASIESHEQRKPVQIRS
jgi:predicted dehydrogenase